MCIYYIKRSLCNFPEINTLSLYIAAIRSLEGNKRRGSDIQARATAGAASGMRKRGIKREEDVYRKRMSCVERERLLKVASAV